MGEADVQLMEVVISLEVVLKLVGRRSYGARMWLPWRRRWLGRTRAVYGWMVGLLRAIVGGAGAGGAWRRVVEKRVVAGHVWRMCYSWWLLTVELRGFGVVLVGRLTLELGAGVRADGALAVGAWGLCRADRCGGVSGLVVGGGESGWLAWRSYAGSFGRW